MANTSWDEFENAKNKFHAECDRLTNSYLVKLRELHKLLDTCVKGKKTSAPILHPVVYNTDLENFKGIADIERVKLIIVADNPGMEEQKNRKYLFGVSGNTAREVMCDETKLKQNSVYGIEGFGKDVLVLV